MFLGDVDIRERLASGSLGIDPAPDESQLGAFDIDLRLGTQFLKLPKGDQAIDVLDPAGPWQTLPGRGFLRSVELGQELTIAPGELLMVTTLEYVHMPKDLAGFCCQRALSNGWVFLSAPELSLPDSKGGSPSRSTL
jgi:deoxycytidine triphosphate deaminase